MRVAELPPGNAHLIQVTRFVLHLLDNDARLTGPALEDEDLAEFLPVFHRVAGGYLDQPGALQTLPHEACGLLAADLIKLGTRILARMALREGVLSEERIDHGEAVH